MSTLTPDWADSLAWVCPYCEQPLRRKPAPVGPSATELSCAEHGAFQQIDGIWRFLRRERVDFYDRFVREYETVRRAEGRFAAEPQYYRSLPYRDLTQRRRTEWSQRAQSFRTLLAAVVAPLERNARTPLTAIDLGAGNGWLANRLALRGHRVVAVDLVVNDFDGLGAHRYYESAFVPVQAEYECLPLAPASFDLAIFNASLHYAPAFERTLSHVLSRLRPGGLLAVADTPVYSAASSGRTMVQERETLFRHLYGFPSNALASEHFLTYDRWQELARHVGVESRFVWPVPRWRREVRRLRTRLRGEREPAQFPIIVCSQRSSPPETIRASPPGSREAD